MTRATDVTTRRHPSIAHPRWIWTRLISAMVLLVACYLLSGFIVELVLWRADVCLNARQHERALSWLNTVGWLRPNSAELHFLLARANRRLERFPDVEKHLRRAAELGWPREALEREQWLAQAQTGQFEALRDHWSDLFRSAGSDGPEISRAFVIAALKRFQITDATRVIGLWKADFPDDAEPYFQEGKIAAVTLRWKDAEAAFRQAQHRAVDRVDIREALIEACMQQLEFHKAQLELKQLLQRDPENRHAQVELADCQIRLGSIEEARGLLKKVLQHDPNQRDALILTAQLELAEGRASLAVETLRRVGASSSEDAELRYLFAQALRAAGDNEEAEQHYQYREAAREPLLRLSKATGELVAAPTNQALRYEVGELTWRWKSHDEGANWMLSLLEFNPAHQAAHALLARHYELKGNAAKAAYHRNLAGTVEFIP